MIDDRRGFALLAALWLLVALSVIGLEFGLRARSAQLAVANGIEAAAARAVAEGGLETVYARLERQLRRGRAFETESPNVFLDPWGKADTLFDRPQSEDGPEIRLDDLGGHLNLNLAGEDDLRRLFAALRVDLGAADQLSQAIADWRDTDQLHRARGAERDAYLRAGAAVLPADAPFGAVEELGHVRGVTPELLNRLRPLLTVWGTGRINLNAAPREVLLALPGMTDAAVAVIEDRRGAGRPIRSLPELYPELSDGPRTALQAAAPALQSRLIFETQEILARASAHPTGSPVHVEARGLFVQSAGALFLIWRQVD